MSPSRADLLLALATGTAALVAALAIVGILAFVAREALPALHEPGALRFLGDDAWRPTAGADARFGMAPMLAGSLLVTLGALLLAGPAGVLYAVCARQLAPAWLGALLRRAAEILNGLPSVLFGLWGLVVLAPRLHALQPPGQSLLAGALVLALMIVPTVALTTDAALRAAPAETLRAAAALGLGPWRTLRAALLPGARRGILAGLFLGGARALGETMAVVMVCGNVVQVPSSVFDPIRTVTANIALEMGYATAEHRAALFASGLALMLLLAGLALLVRPEGAGVSGA